MKLNNKVTVLITSTREVEVYADSDNEALQIVEKLFNSGDAIAELESAEFKVIERNNI